MTKKKNIVANILLLTYVLVMLHNVFPHHHHGDSGAENCHIENHDDNNNSHDSYNIFSFLTFHPENSNADKSLICHFSDSFSKSNLTSDFISSCSLTGVRFFADISTLHFKYNRLSLVQSYYNPLSSRAPPIV